MTFPAPISDTILRAGVRVQAQTLKCRCGATITIPCNTVSSPLPRQIVHKKAAQQGWKTGRRPKCPDCK